MQIEYPVLWSGFRLPSGCPNPLRRGPRSATKGQRVRSWSLCLTSFPKAASERGVEHRTRRRKKKERRDAGHSDGDWSPSGVKHADVLQRPPQASLHAPYVSALSLSLHRSLIPHPPLRFDLVVLDGSIGRSSLLQIHGSTCWGWGWGPSSLPSS